MEANKSFTETSSDDDNMKLGDILGKENSKDDAQEESSSRFEEVLLNPRVNSSVQKNLQKVSFSAIGGSAEVMKIVKLERFLPLRLSPANNI